MRAGKERSSFPAFAFSTVILLLLGSRQQNGVPIPQLSGSNKADSTEKIRADLERPQPWALAQNTAFARVRGLIDHRETTSSSHYGCTLQILPGSCK